MSLTQSQIDLVKSSFTQVEPIAETAAGCPGRGGEGLRRCGVG